MSRTRESLFVAALALCSPWAVADSITVNTTTDDFQANSLCSLREAVEYFNRGKPEGGFQGCTTEGRDESDVVTVPGNADPYRIAGTAITVRTNLYIAGEERTGDIPTKLRVEGAHRAFVVNYNPQYVPPRCSPNCASDPSSFNLVPLSDTGTAGDYLTTQVNPEVTVVLPGVAIVPPATSLPPHSYIIRVYQTFPDGIRYKVGEERAPLSATAATLTIPLSSLTLQFYGVHHLTYSLEKVDNVTDASVEAEAVSPATLKYALYPATTTASVRMDNMIIEGGCPASTTCATDVDDNTVLVNDTASSNAAYDEFALSYTNGLTNTAGKGGIIYNGEALFLYDVLLTGGGAPMGGAVYVTALGGMRIDKSEFILNRADNGAALYFEYNSADVDHSLFTENVVTTPAGAGAVVEVAAATVLEPFDETSIVNTTFSGNSGRALSLRAGAKVNASTIVLNQGGIDFNGADVKVFNTILVGNTTNPDCEEVPVAVVASNNLIEASGSCPSSGAGNQTISNQDGTPGQLMAQVVDEQCVGTYGLLCPLEDHGGATRVHLPRLLPDYDLSGLGIAQSPIINKGADQDSDFVANCPAQDQREKTRQDCDIGAVELQAVTQSYVRSGGTTGYGVPYVEFMGQVLEDEEILPAAKCPARVSLQTPAAPPYYPPPELAPDPTAVVGDSYRPDVPGCPWLEVSPARGTVEFTVDGNYEYTAAYQFHGTDRFHYRIVTTLSFLNAMPNDRSRVVRAMVISEPSTSASSEKLSGAMGALDLAILGAFGLFVRRRVRA